MAEDSTERSTDTKSTGINNRTKVILGIMVSALVAVMTTGIATMQNSIAQTQAENPTQS